MKSMSQTGGIAAGCGFRRHVCVSLFLFRHQSGLTQYTGVLFFCILRGLLMPVGNYVRNS